MSLLATYNSSVTPDKMRVALASLFLVRAGEDQVPLGDADVRRNVDDVMSRYAGTTPPSSISAFISRVSGDVGAIIAQRKNEVRNSNIYSGPHQLGPDGRPLHGAGSLAAAASTSSARYDTLGEQTAAPQGRELGGAYWHTPQGMSEARAFAVSSGVPWVANNTELLHLGTSAIREIAAAHLSQESFNLLKDKAAFSARDVVTLAHFANTQHIDANGLAHTLARNNGIIAGNNPNLLRQIRDAETQYMANPDSPEAKERLRRTMMEAAGNDPKKIKAAQENLEKLKAQQRRELERQNTTKKSETVSHTERNTAQTERNTAQTERNTAQTERNTAQTDKKRDTTAINNLNALAPQSAATPSPQRPDPAKKTPRAVKAPA